MKAGLLNLWVLFMGLTASYSYDYKNDPSASSCRELPLKAAASNGVLQLSSPFERIHHDGTGFNFANKPLCHLRSFFPSSRIWTTRIEAKERDRDWVSSGNVLGLFWTSTNPAFLSLAQTLSPPCACACVCIVQTVWLILSYFQSSALHLELAAGGCSSSSSSSSEEK